MPKSSRYRLLLVVLAALGTLPARAEQADLYVELLRSMDVEPDQPSLDAYLRSLHPDEAARRLMAEQIQRLGSDDFFVREKATRALLRHPAVPVPMLQAAIESGDPEVRWRAKQILDEADERTARVLYAVFYVIRERELKGLADPVLDAMPYCQEEYLRQANRAALRATVEPEDADRLREAIGGEDAQQQIAAVSALAALLKEQALDDLRPLLDEEDDLVRLEAALALANQGERKALKPLVDLLDSENLRVRIRSNRALRNLTGENFSFVAYEAPAKRSAATEKWKAWLAGKGQTAKLTYPLKQFQPMIGRTLIAYYSSNQVVELDEAGKQVWQQQATQPWGCHALPNGHRIIASYNTRQVVEFDASGDKVWEATGLEGRPFSVRRLENGNTLLPYYSKNQVVELSPKKKVVWKIDVEGNPMDARRLENGNTLICLLRANAVVEVDRKGKEVWKLPNMFGPRSAQRLENGNTLVCQTNAGKVVEVDRRKEVVWEHVGLNNPFDAQRLPNGNTLIAHGGGVIEVDHQNKTIWRRAGGGVSSVYRY